jgi:hypothetical protein
MAASNDSFYAIIRPEGIIQQPPVRQGQKMLPIPSNLILSQWHSTVS